MGVVGLAGGVIGGLLTAYMIHLSLPSLLGRRLLFAGFAPVDRRLLRRRLGVALLAAWWPARRAARLNLLIALHTSELPGVLGEKGVGLRRAEKTRVAAKVDRRFAAVVEHGDCRPRQRPDGRDTGIRWSTASPQTSRPSRQGKPVRRRTLPRLLSTIVASDRLRRSTQGMAPGRCAAIDSPPRKNKPRRNRRMASVSRRIESNNSGLDRIDGRGG